jgi:hypothetical protein
VDLSTVLHHVQQSTNSVLEATKQNISQNAGNPLKTDQSVRLAIMIYVSPEYQFMLSQRLIIEMTFGIVMSQFCFSNFIHD